ncbi:MAG: DUF190 domain-containing protein [Deltaproteobacteria bacterium]|nr:DUF190 domain-containing protein [Deltaproteobacteria bacterium]
MTLPEEATLLRIIVEDSDRMEGKPLHEVIVTKAHEMGLAGASAFQGLMGFGAHSHIHKVQALRQSGHLPVAIEIVDAEERLRPFLPWLNENLKEGVATMQTVKVLHYRHRDE